MLFKCIIIYDRGNRHVILPCRLNMHRKYINVILKYLNKFLLKVIYMFIVATVVHVVSSPDPKGDVKYCYHCTSIAITLAFHIFQTPLQQISTLLWWTATLIVIFISFGNSTWLLNQLCFLNFWCNGFLIWLYRVVFCWLEIQNGCHYLK